jgi:uncharacterized membrane protein
MKKIFIFLVILLSLPTIWPLFHPGLFPMHDDTQVARVLTMGKALHDGMLPVRWVDYLGYNFGYPIFNFYAPFAYYLGGFFTLLGFSALTSTKIMMGLGMITAGVSMYLLAQSIFGKKAGVLASVFYMYAPYHASNLFVRGAISELWAFAFLPLPFWGLWGLYKKGKFRYAVVTALTLAIIITSHNLTAMMIVPFILLEFIVLSIASSRRKEFKMFYLGGISLVIGILLSAYYSIPALLEMQYTNVSSILGGGSNPIDHFVCVTQLWQSMWGYGGSAPGCVDGMSFMLGKIHVVFVLAGIISTAYLLQKRLYKESFVLLSCFFVLVISLFMMLDTSKTFWQSVSLLNYIQFPWRFLSLAVFSSSLIGGGVIAVLNKIKPRIALLMTISVSLLCLLYYGKFFAPQYYQEDIKRYSDISQITWNVSKISDEYLSKGIKKPVNSSQVSANLLSSEKGQIRIQSTDEKTQKKTINLTSSDSQVRLNLAYFPAWQIKVDNKVINPNIASGHYIFPLRSGQHTITATFIQTSTEFFSTILSLVGLSFLILGIIKTRINKSL